MIELLDYEKRALPVPRFPFGLAHKSNPSWDSTMSTNATGIDGGSLSGENNNADSASGDGGGGENGPWTTGYWRSVTDCDNNTFNVWTQGPAS